MNKHLLWAIGFGLVAVGGFLWWQAAYAPVVEETDDSTATSVEAPDSEAAELTAFGFMQDLLAAGEDEAARERLYLTLSAAAQGQVSEETLLDDVLEFLQMPDKPEQGVSVENLEIHSDTESTLIVGLNFNAGRELRALDMVVEDGEWKIDRVRVLETYPPEDEVSTPPRNGDTDDGGVTARGDCYVGGCSGQLCTEDPEAISTCEWLEEYACYRDATCERQADGQCGWTQTDTLVECLATSGEHSAM